MDIEKRFLVTKPRSKNNYYLLTLVTVAYSNLWLRISSEKDFLHSDHQIFVVFQIVN